jgi:maltooligosyltrehalose synthase
MGDVAPANLCSDDTTMWLTRRLLAIRRSHTTILETGGYAAIASRETPHVFAFARTGNGRNIVTVVPRFVARLVDSRGRVAASEWGDAILPLPGGGAWRDCLTGSHWTGNELRVRNVLGNLPFAVLIDGDG